MTFEQWKNEVAKIAEEELRFNDLWDDDDPYEIDLLSKEAFYKKMTARKFFFDIFAEDIEERDDDLDEEEE